MERFSAYILVYLCIGFSSFGQKYTLDKSSIEFFSKATIEDIKADNIKSSSLLNIGTGEVVITIPIKSFEFEKALMKEHFNEKYLESEKYPRAIFQGKFVPNIQHTIDQQSVTAIGKLTIHGVTREVQLPGTIEWKDSQVLAKASFIVRLEDYQIKIPQILWQNIAEEVSVSVELIYKPQ